MIGIDLEQQEEERKFAVQAAIHFHENPRDVSFTAGDIKPGAFLALRWGLTDNSVLVLKLCEDHMPANYRDLVRRCALESGACDARR